VLVTVIPATKVRFLEMVKLPEPPIAGLLVTPVQSISRQALATSMSRIAAAPATQRLPDFTLSVEMGTDAPVAPPLVSDHVPVDEKREEKAAGSIAYRSAVAHLPHHIA